MVLDLEKFTWTDGKTPVSAAELNTRFWGIVRRLHDLETLSINWEAAVAEVQNHGLAKINEAVLPLLDTLKSDLDVLVVQGRADLAGYSTQVDALIARGDAASAAIVASVSAFLTDGSERVDAVIVEANSTLAGLQGVIASLCPLNEEGLVPEEHIPASVGIPSGVIVMWSGAADAVPSGWALCDGNNGTPDLRDKFLIGAGNTYAVGATGGANTHSHTASTGAHTLTEAQMPHHRHGLTMGYTSSDQGLVGGGTNTAWGTLYTGYAGGNASHNHTATVDGASSLPPYYALAFIMKV